MKFNGSVAHSEILSVCRELGNAATANPRSINRPQK